MTQLLQKKCKQPEFNYCYHAKLTIFHSITVAASNIDDELLSTSYFGKCVNIIAPVSYTSFCTLWKQYYQLSVQGKKILTTILNEETKEKRGAQL